MTSREDDKLFGFLREHYPAPPAAPSDERARIAHRTSERRLKIGWRVFVPLTGLTAAAAALLIVSRTSLRNSTDTIFESEMGALVGLFSEEGMTASDGWIAVVDGLIDED